MDSQLLLEKRGSLIDRFINQRDFGFLEAMSGILDDYFHSVFGQSRIAREMTARGTPVALIALGGYGRQEQCIHSDVDLLILFEKKVPDGADELVQEFLYPLWDAHLETGYAVRTIKECLLLSWERFDIFTTILDARFICGASHIYSRLMEKFRKELDRRHKKRSLVRLGKYSEKLHRDYGDSSYLLEPNLKMGHGGLRDYHTLRWYARIIGDIRIKRDLERYGFISHDEYSSLDEALHFVWDVRNLLHYVTGRKCDQLHFERQVNMADLLGYTKGNGNEGVEIFLGDLHARMDFMKQVNLILKENYLTPRRIGINWSRPKPTRIPGIEIKERRLGFTSMERVPAEPALLINIFVESGRLKIPLSIEARRIVGEFAYLIDDDFRRDRENIRSFERVLSFSLWEFNVLNVMLSTGLLVRFIPEFAGVIHKIQYNHYHLFPVDKHLIRSVQIINSFRKKKHAGENRFYTVVYQDIRARKLLIMAALLHDIGKSDPSREHSVRGARIVRTILERFGYTPAEIDTVAFLVENHLFMVKTATRRDIGCEETAVFCASHIKRVGYLRMLYLLSVADSMATGPKAWNSWTESLLRDLFLKTMAVLKEGELASRKAVRVIQAKKDAVLELGREHWDEAGLNKILDAMAHRYLLHITPRKIMEHIELFQELGDNHFVWTISSEADPQVRTVSICGRDKPGFFSKIAGVFFMNNIDILGSQAFSWGGNTAMDIFKVRPPRDLIFEDAKWNKAAGDLNQAIEDDSFLERLSNRTPSRLTSDPGHNFKPNQVRIDNETSSFFTIIEVITYDFPGLLFAVTNTLYRQGLDVQVAMVATKVDQVMDVFYVRSVDDGKVCDPDQVEAVVQAVLSSLPQIIGTA